MFTPHSPLARFLRTHRVAALATSATFAAALISHSSLAIAGDGPDDPFADVVTSYDAGVEPNPAYLDASVTIGSPERFTGEGIFPSVVSPFNGAFGTDELVSIGRGGHLTLEFATPVTDDASNPWGIDLLIFGNVAFVDLSYPNGIANGVFSVDAASLDVSEDGIIWQTVTEHADGLFPTLGYLDAGPYDTEPGNVETSFTRPVDPALRTADFDGLGYIDVFTHYRGSGGGVGVDLAPTGLTAIRFVRITNPAGAKTDIQIDAVSDVTAVVTGDLDGDGLVGVSDLIAALSTWGGCPAPPLVCDADFDGDGVVAFSDLLVLLGAWSS